ncbi:hypothetical protein NA57DRAFT_54530 [Rhizodiscina lignyota]|uniref:Tat pathway signal sequence n=1 Tax=Rhizodiscina lignyota TaxID=1504668 RepID=A0A9P4ILQ3_9PEZI|nr:hypothetical protein NA57DRAFT_54530 [Rhizodiscina lignyota]
MISFSKLQERLRPSSQYLRIEEGDNEELKIQTSPEPSQTRTTCYRRSFLLSGLLNVILAGACLSLSLRSWSWHDNGVTEPKDTSFASSGFYSPLTDRVDLTPRLTTLNGTFLDEHDPENPLRLLPGEKADSAWKAVSEIQYITVSHSEVIKLGRDPAALVRAPEEWGFGSDRYIAMMDLTHQLHCINYLRRAAFPDYYKRDMYRKPEFYEQHTMHCVYMLYQNAMCAAGTEVITYNWLEGQQFPVPDFSINKMCRSGDALLEYERENMVEDLIERRSKMTRPEDAVVLPVPKKLKAWLEWLETA